MKTRTVLLGVVLTFVLVAVGTLPAQQAVKVHPLAADQLTKLLPASVFLDGENVPVQKRNAVGAHMEDGKILLVMLLDTAGYSSQYSGKYVGMLMAQGNVTISSSKVKPGVYGLGKKPAAAGKAGESFALYDLGGNAVADIPATKDDKLKPVAPIQLKAEAGAMRLYLGQSFVTIR